MEVVDETRLDERRETCLNATFAEFAIMGSSTTLLEMGVRANRCRSLYVHKSERSLTSTSLRLPRNMKWRHKSVIILLESITYVHLHMIKHYMLQVSPGELVTLSTCS